MKIKELFTDESKWTKGRLYGDKNGQTTVQLSEAESFCLLGACTKCYRDLDERVKIENKIYEAILPSFTVGRFNDTHSFTEVKELVERLDI